MNQLSALDPRLPAAHAWRFVLSPLVTVLTVLSVEMCVWGSVAEAQVTSARWPPISSLRAGDTVRVWVSSPPLSGRTGLVARLDNDTLVLDDLPGRRTVGGGVAVPFRTLTRIEVRRGYRRSVGWTIAGVALGIAGGTLIGATAGVLLECGGSCSGEGGLAGIAGFVIGGGIGGLAGGVVGGIIGGQRRSRWDPIAPAR